MEGGREREGGRGKREERKEGGSERGGEKGGSAEGRSRKGGRELCDDGLSD